MTYIITELWKNSAYFCKRHKNCNVLNSDKQERIATKAPRYKEELFIVF
jgi:hypothetical protein